MTRVCAPVDVRRRHGALITAIVLLALTVVFMFAASPPSWFQPPATHDQDAAERARGFERNFAAELSRIRDDEPWALRIHERDLNAWLWLRLPAWAAHAHGPEDLAAQPRFQVQMTPGRVRFWADPWILGLQPRVVNTNVELAVVRGSGVGRLPVPAFIAQAGLGSLDLDILDSEVLLGTLGDGRRIEVLEIQLDEGEMVLILRTVHAGSEQK